MRYTLYIMALAVIPAMLIGCCPCSKSGKCPAKTDSAAKCEMTTETPAAETPATETPATETPATETPAAETPAAETPATETPAIETPAIETPAIETPATEPLLSIDPPAPEITETVVEKPAPAPVEPSSTMTSSDDRQAMPGTKDQWRPETSNDVDWMAKELSSHHLKAAADNSSLLEGDQKAGHTYKNVTKQDLVIWEQETKRLVVEGSRIFHSADLLGSTNGVSCDMCHPDARDTHPQTYPKYQVQLGRAAVLRDMCNWCLENPCRGKPLSGDDPKMRALEAYIQANNAGEVMQYNKH